MHGSNATAFVVFRFEQQVSGRTADSSPRQLALAAFGSFNSLIALFLFVDICQNGELKDGDDLAGEDLLD